MENCLEELLVRRQGSRHFGLCRRAAGALETAQVTGQRIGVTVEDQGVGGLTHLGRDVRVRGDRAGFTMAMSSPAATAWYRKTLLSARRPGGVNPKETLLTPRLVRTPGSAT
jgi:hypothetical protein